jgi:pimeloyl-ACP methyl ester carboxylesterase
MTNEITSGAVRVDGLRIHYLTAGAGPAVVLLAGFPQTSDAWRKIIPSLAEHFSVYAVDLPGLGHSDKPSDGYDTKSVATRLYKALQALGLNRLHLVGHDLGAWVAATFAAMFRDEVTRLVVMEGGIPGVAGVQPIPADFNAWQRNAHFLFHMLPDIPEILISGREEQYLSWFITRQLANPTAISANELAAYARVYAAPGALRAALGYYRAVFTDAEQNLELLANKLPMPVLALDGEGKSNPLVEALAPYTLNLRGGYIKGSGHFIPEEQPDLLLKELFTFFAENQ